MHLADTRFEVRDTQFLAGMLADQGLVDPQRIGVTGGSYGGGQSMALAALRDRQMNADGSLVPWKSQGGKAMRIAAAAPIIPWTDLAYSLMPNGRTLDYTVANLTQDVDPIGVEKQSFVSGLYAAGLAERLLLAASASIPTPTSRSGSRFINAGEPYDSNPQATGVASQIAKLPLQLLHPRRPGAGAAVHLQRLDRRPLPGRRGAALLQPPARQLPVVCRSS